VLSQSVDQTNHSDGNVASGPYNAKRYDNLGTTEGTHDDLNDAIKEFTRAIQLNTNDAVAYEGRGCCYFAKSDISKAIEDFNTSIMLNPTNARAYLNRSNAYRAMTDLDKALRDLDACLQLEPTNSLAYKQRASVYGAKGDVKAEIGDWNSALKLTPNDATVLAYRGYAYFKSGHFDKAVGDYYKAIQVNPENAMAYNNLAWLRATCPVAELRNGKEAVDAATKACALDNWQDANSVDTLAAACAEAGDFERAIEYQKKAMGMEGNSKTALADMQSRLSLYERHQPDHNGQKQ
jgi:tetratricopeptide (TPR) repeat protein